MAMHLCLLVFSSGGSKRDVKFKGRACLSTDFWDFSEKTSLMGASSNKNKVAGINMMLGDGELECQGWIGRMGLQQEKANTVH